jgi:hypothetical protein
VQLCVYLFVKFLPNELPVACTRNHFFDFSIFSIISIFFDISGETQPSDERLRGRQRPDPGNLAPRLQVFKQNTKKDFVKKRDIFVS